MLNDIEKLRFYAHKVLPLVYDDSLSYYEVLCKVVAKLNEVIALADSQNSAIEDIIQDVEDFEAETNTKYNQFVAQIEADLEAFETEMRTAQSDFETEISGELTEFEGTMQDLYDEFLENYQRTFGIQDSFGTSTTDAISQACVSQLIDYTGDTPIVKGDNLPIDDTTSGVDKLWSSDKIEDEIEEVNTDLSADIDALETRMTTAESDINTLESGLETANNNISGLNTVTTTLAGQVAGIASSQQVLSGKVSTLETSVGTLSSDVTSLSTQVTQMDTDVDNLQDDMLEAQTDIETAEGKITTLEGKMSTAEDDIDTIEGDITTIEGNITTLGNSITYEAGRIDGLNTRLGIAETDINNLEDDMSSAEADIANLESRMDTAESDIDTLEGKMSTAEDDIDSLETRMTTAENDIDNLEENKANRVGDEKLLISGGSRGLLYGKINDGEPYNYRVTAGGKSVGNLKKVKSLVGGTLALNQLIANGNFMTTAWWSVNRGSFAVSNNKGIYTATSDVTGSSYIQGSVASSHKIAGHIYYISVIAKPSVDTNIEIRLFGINTPYVSVSAGERKQISRIINYDTASAEQAIFYTNYGGLMLTEGDTVEFENAMLIDLTELFGTIPQTVGVTSYNSIANYLSAIETANSGAGIAWLYKYFPILNDDYIPYGVPTLESVCCDKSISEEHEYNMGHETLRGVYMLDSNGNLYCDPTKNDTKTSDGEITRRMGRINLGTLTWIYQSANTRFYSEGLQGLIAGPASTSDIIPAICEKYSNVNFNTFATETTGMIAFGSTGNVFIKDTGYTDGNALKTALNGVYLEYPLATPTTESGTPYTELQICKTDGTEELTDYEVEEGNRVVPIPVGHTTEYDKDIAPELNNLLSILPTANGDYLLNVNNGAYSFQSATNRSVETLTPIEKTKEEKAEITSEEIPEERSEENEELSD